MPVIEEMTMKLANSRCLTKLDLTKGFYQVKLKPCDQEKTAFLSPFGKFQFTRMPFGLRNAPATFQRLVERVLQGTEEIVSIYIDDILIASQDWQSHLDHIRLVLGLISQSGLRCKKKKCEIGKKYVVYLGHVIGDGHMSIPDARVAAIRDHPRPVTKRQLRSFLGLLSSYRKYVRDYGSKAAPLDRQYVQLNNDIYI